MYFTAIVSLDVCTSEAVSIQHYIIVDFEKVDSQTLVNIDWIVDVFLRNQENTKNKIHTYRDKFLTNGVQSLYDCCIYEHDRAHNVSCNFNTHLREIIDTFNTSTTVMLAFSQIQFN